MLLLAAPLLLAAALRHQDDPFQAWAEDVEHLVAEIERLHPDPYFACPRAEFERGIDRFLSAIGPDEERNVVELMRLVALLARAGRDGHSLSGPSPSRRCRSTSTASTTGGSWWPRTHRTRSSSAPA
jgi:hypothetical protein